MSDRQNSGLGWVVAGVAGFFIVRGLVRRIAEPVAIKQYADRILVNIPAVRFKGDDVEFDIYIQNPNSYPMTINALIGDVTITSNNGRTVHKLGNIRKYGRTIIQPVSETKIQLAIRLKFLPLLAYFNDLLAGKIKGQIFRFDGTININGRPYPVHQQKQIA